VNGYPLIVTRVSGPCMLARIDKSTSIADRTLSARAEGPCHEFALHHMRSSLASFAQPIARGLSLFFGGFTLLNLIGSRVSPGFDANIWWIDMSFAPGWLANVLLFIGSAELLGFAVGFPRYRLLGLAIAPLLLVAAGNVVSFYRQWQLGRIQPRVPIPLSLVLFITLGFILLTSLRNQKLIGRAQHIVFSAAFIASLFLFPLAQMYCFGMTDYRRSTDAIVVFGARTYADGTPSWVLADRTLTAIDLYKKHLAPKLIFSGGPGDGATSEPQAMRNMALSMGVPNSAIILDEFGLNTDRTVINTTAIFQQQHMQKVLAVSHFYHLPRVKMAYARSAYSAKMPVEVFTVPAEDRTVMSRLPWYMTREIAALWMYYLRPLGV
jgi:uncharacterized SAM-binding protein YcdF (DUF218 family)